ncbi:hypothetical protein EV356DRAFT_510065 [Viridothelium virens]|uniref:G-patch domain-containing protein n=1 Tax=Viridothelium virens TaxID=1048519 RepID=A0A6A6GVX8_VIRVR|nr:hypothetical protein EV356DRAFT_510065 [Viridothelium virens]
MERLREMERLSEIERLLEIERLENSSENEWICAECDQPVQGHRCGQCHADHPTRERKFTVQNRAEVGDKDASPDGTPSQYLLVRQLAGNVTEEVLAKGLEKLYKGAGTSGTSDAASTKPKAKVISTTSTANLGAPVGSLRRVLFIRSKHNWQSCRYGFAEFFTAEDAKAAMAKFKALDTITISSKPITLAYAHSGVFMPASEANPDYAFKSAANPSQLLKYWNREAFAREFTVALSASEPSVRSEHPNANPVAAVTNDQGTLQNVKDKETKSKKRKAEGEVTAAKKKTIPSHLQFWQDRRAELHGVKPENGEKNDRQYSTNPSSDPIPPPDTEVDDSPSLEYGDPNRKCCYLCMRKFQTISETIKHERLSALHQKNLKDARTRLMALARVRKFVPKLHSAISQTPAYRDRAAERRQVYNQPKFAPIKMGFKKKQAASTERSPSSDETAAAPSKGASLLGKMGYVEGQGLGATGEGRTAPIETEMYREGVGLGAEGGKVGDAAKEAARNTRGNYNEFLEKTREKAQERYNSMMK